MNGVANQCGSAEIPMIEDTLLETDQVRTSSGPPQFSKYLWKESAHIPNQDLSSTLTKESEIGRSATDAAAVSASALLHLAFVGHLIACGIFQQTKK